MGHIPVLLSEVIKYLNPESGQNFIDATLGGGGHALAILEKNKPDGKLLGIDANRNAIEKFKNKNDEISRRIILANDNFANLQNIVRERKFVSISGILADLGFSSIELDESKRGFSFLKEETLDMRFGEGELSAKEIVNLWPPPALEKIFKEYGEERFSKQIALKIIELRKIRPIISTLQLVEVIKAATPVWYHHRKTHPATKVFQALRIAVNDELENLKKFLPQAIEILPKKGRLVIISFHSLEDRIVKNFFREKKQAGLIEILTKKAVVPTAEEIKKNFRSRSAKLRSVVKL